MNIDTPGSMTAPIISDDQKLKHLLTCSYPPVPTCIACGNCAIDIGCVNYNIVLEGKSVSRSVSVSIDFISGVPGRYALATMWNICSI